MYVKDKEYIEIFDDHFLDYDNDYVPKGSISRIYSQLLIKNLSRSLSTILLKKGTSRKLHKQVK